MGSGISVAVTGAEMSERPETSWKNFLERFEQACETAKRASKEIQILPVSKGQKFSHIEEFLRLENFPQALGENYLFELEEKSRVIPRVEWHYLGALQSRKIAALCNVAQVFHGVSRSKEIEMISAADKNTKFFLQINISNEGQKLGADEKEIPQLLEKVSVLKLDKNFLGFMGMASELGQDVGEEVARDQFARLRKLRDQYCPSKKLSMGMSGDFELAIAEGSDLVRIGSLIFGSRT